MLHVRHAGFVLLLASACTSQPATDPVQSQSVTATGVLRQVKGGYRLAAHDETWLEFHEPVPADLLGKRVRVTGQLREGNAGDCSQDRDNAVQTRCGSFRAIVVETIRGLE